MVKLILLNIRNEENSGILDSTLNALLQSLFSANHLTGRCNKHRYED